ncbi:unnamed protein product [Spirodela intermedia]|uniref:GAGA-binding transcriptional activator n=1 Tax=Spirodela intermedia TaxID=51605 RepID=A0A7I8J2Q6_SPIIN|nr:unnamed protein product [Spirodela intermedia]CAA6664262.1 unnamed protein product [Spirodela intermedia]
MKGGLSLQLMSAGERDPKPIIHNGTFLQRDCGVQEPPMIHVLPMNHNYGSGAMDVHAAGNPHTLQMLEQPEPTSKIEKVQGPSDPGNGRKGTPAKKRAQEKNPYRRDGANNIKKNSASSQGKGPKKSMAMVINGMNLDISQIPTPVCSCTGTTQQCYRWGTGGWQSACCTTNISMYPLPMNTKRRGARIAGRKMSLGAFKKVLEKLVCEGHDLSNSIDLKTHWAKHGTNKFVTIK